MPLGGLGRVEAWLRRGGRQQVVVRGGSTGGAVEITGPYRAPLVVPFADFLIGGSHEIVRARFGASIVEEIRDEIRRRG